MDCHFMTQTHTCANLNVMWIKNACVLEYNESNEDRKERKKFFNHVCSSRMHICLFDDEDGFFMHVYYTYGT